VGEELQKVIRPKMFFEIITQILVSFVSTKGT